MPRESSAVMRFIDLVQNQPLIEKPLEEPSAFAEASRSVTLPERSGDTEIVRTVPAEHEQTSTSKLWYVLGAVCFVGLGVGIGLYANAGSAPNAAAVPAANTTNNTNTVKPSAALTPDPAVGQTPGAKPPTSAAAVAPVAAAVKKDEAPAIPEMTAAQLSQTGFDIRVTPIGAAVRLDGKDIGIAPLRVRKLKAGSHKIEITAPEGYVSTSKEYELVVGEGKEVSIKLEKVAVELPPTVVASFTSEPPGATVTLFTDGKKLITKTTPIKMKLRTGHEYQAEFSRDGYETIKKPVTIEDGSELKVAAVMQTRAAAVAVAIPTKAATPAKKVMQAKKTAAPARRNLRRPSRRARAKRTRTATRTRRAQRSRRKARTKAQTKTRAGYGTLLIGSKPPCKIYVDGRPTGLTTPQRGIKLKAGKHRIALINREFKIRRIVTVKIRSGKRTRVIRDFSDKMR